MALAIKGLFSVSAWVRPANRCLAFPPGAQPARLLAVAAGPQVISVAAELEELEAPPRMVSLAPMAQVLAPVVVVAAALPLLWVLLDLEAPVAMELPVTVWYMRGSSHEIKMT